MSNARRISKAELSRWAVQRERFQLTDTRPPAPYRITTPESVVTNIMKKVGLEQPLWEQTLLREWPELVGSQIAAHARPGQLDRGTLVIHIDHSIWLHELRGPTEKALLEKLQQRFGRTKIKGLRLRLDPDGPARRA